MGCPKSRSRLEGTFWTCHVCRSFQTPEGRSRDLDLGDRYLPLSHVDEWMEKKKKKKGEARLDNFLLLGICLWYCFPF